jgi:hypothetical protein
MRAECRLPRPVIPPSPARQRRSSYALPVGLGPPRTAVQAVRCWLGSRRRGHQPPRPTPVLVARHITAWLGRQLTRSPRRLARDPVTTTRIAGRSVARGDHPPRATKARTNHEGSDDVSDRTEPLLDRRSVLDVQRTKSRQSHAPLRGGALEPLPAAASAPSCRVGASAGPVMEVIPGSRWRRAWAYGPTVSLGGCYRVATQADIGERRRTHVQRKAQLQRDGASVNEHLGTPFPRLLIHWFRVRVPGGHAADQPLSDHSRRSSRRSFRRR